VHSYDDFFTGSATIAGALVGLLFVALSVQPERNRDRHSVEHRAVAGTAFIALIDALFTSLIGLQPGAGLRYGAVIFGALGLLSSINLSRRLWSARREVQLSRRWSTFMGFIMVVYAAQLAVGLAPIKPDAQASYTAAFIYAMFSLGIARSWELLGMQGTSLVDSIREALTHAPAHVPGHPSAPGDPPGPADPPASS
jgi:energy-converting hydrogenase Eha subunit A